MPLCWNKKRCIKGDSCNLDHSKAALAKPGVKVSKLCRNKEAYGVKPICKYIHPKDGYEIPAIIVANSARGQGFAVGLKGI